MANDMTDGYGVLNTNALTIKLPKWNITFTGENGCTVGKLEINDDQLQFTGNADEAARIFFAGIGGEFDAVRKENKALQARIKELEKELDDWKAQGFDFSPDEY